jgi:hypothetical protein
VLALLLAGFATRLPLDRRWIEVRTRHFSITSAMSEERSVELARGLEVFRSGVLRLTNVDASRILKREYVHFLMRRRLGLISGLRGPRISRHDNSRGDLRLRGP